MPFRGGTSLYIDHPPEVTHPLSRDCWKGTHYAYYFIIFFLQSTLPCVTWEAIDSNWGNRGFLPTVNKLNVLVKPAENMRNDVTITIDCMLTILAAWVGLMVEIRRENLQIARERHFLSSNYQWWCLHFNTCVNESCLLMEGRGGNYMMILSKGMFFNSGFLDGLWKIS